MGVGDISLEFESLPVDAVKFGYLVCKRMPQPIPATIDPSNLYINSSLELFFDDNCLIFEHDYLKNQGLDYLGVGSIPCVTIKGFSSDKLLDQYKAWYDDPGLWADEFITLIDSNGLIVYDVDVPVTVSNIQICDYCPYDSKIINSFASCILPDSDERVLSRINTFLNRDFNLSKVINAVRDKQRI